MSPERTVLPAWVPGTCPLSFAFPHVPVRVEHEIVGIQLPVWRAFNKPRRGMDQLLLREASESPRNAKGSLARAHVVRITCLLRFIRRMLNIHSDQTGALLLP